RHRSRSGALSRPWRQADPVPWLERPSDPGARLDRLLRGGPAADGRSVRLLPPLHRSWHAPLRWRQGPERGRLAGAAAGLGGAGPGARRRHGPEPRSGRGCRRGEPDAASLHAGRGDFIASLALPEHLRRIDARPIPAAADAVLATLVVRNEIVRVA